MRYVIIGGSAAAIGCIEGVRSVDKTGEIILITGETEWNYSRPLISYLLEGKTTRDKMWCRPDSFFTRNGVTVKAGVLATTLDAGDRTVRLSTGERLAYDRLLAATGSRPFVPPIPGLETVERTFCFQTLSDASALAEALRPEPRAHSGRGPHGRQMRRGHPRPVRADRHCGPCAPRAACCTG